MIRSERHLLPFPFHYSRKRSDFPRQFRIHSSIMKNISIVEEIEISNVLPDARCVCLTSNPFLGEIYILTQTGIVVGLLQEDHSVRVLRVPEE